MILLGSELEAAGLMLLRDHASPETFHYLPGPPRLVFDSQRVGLQLVRFRGTRRGAWLALDVELGVDEATLAAAQGRLAERFGPVPNLVPVLFKTGSVRLCALGAASGALVETVLGTGLPSLLGRGRATFALELSAEGAALVAQALAAPELPLVLVYELVYEGLRPARGLHAQVETAQAYDHLRARFAAGTLVLRADLDTETEKLAREGWIRIEDVDYQGDDPALRARRQLEVQATLRELSEALFFRPAASPALMGPAGATGPVAEAWAQHGRPRSAFVLRSLEQHELQTLEYDLREVRVAAARVAPQAALRLPAGFDPARLVTDVDGDWPPTLASVAIAPAPGADWSGVAAVAVDVRRGRELHGAVVRRDSAAVVLPCVGAGGLEYRLRPLLEAEPEALGLPPAGEPAFEPLDRLHIFVDPARAARRRTVEVTLAAVDTELASGARGTLSAGGRQRAFVLDSQRRSVTVPVWGDLVCHVTAEILTAAGAGLIVTAAAQPGETLLVLSPPPSALLGVTVELQDPLERYESVFVELEGPAGERRRGLNLGPAARSASWWLPRGPEDPRTFRYRVRKLAKDARVVDEDWRAGAGPLLPVGDLDLRLETVAVVPLGLGAASGAVVRLTPLDPPPGVDGSFEALLEPGQEPLTARLALRREAPLRYRVDARLFTAEGERALPAFESSDEVLLLSF